MSAVTMETRDNGSGRKFFLFIIAIIIFSSILFAVAYSPHAVEKHGVAAEVVRYCIEKNGPLETWNNSNTGRDAHIVCTPEGTFGIQVCDKNDCEVTSFLKEKMKKIDQIYQYLSNRGYSPK